MNPSKPQFQERKSIYISFAIISGLLLGLSFPPSPLYSLVYVAFIPLLYLFVIFDSFNKMLKYSYLFLFVFHLITIYWTGGFVIGKDIWMMTAGAMLIFVHPILFLPFILCSFFIKKRLGVIQGLIAFALFWVSFEYIHSLGEYSFPWLTIGSSQAYDIYRIQFIEYVSVYGMSLFILVFNIISFLLIWSLTFNGWRVILKFILISLSILAFMYFGSAIYGRYVIEKELAKTEKTIRVGIVQPNIDPWDKWGDNSIDKWESYQKQFNMYLNETKELVLEKPDIVVWPETAIPFHILLPRHSNYLTRLCSLVDTLKIQIFTGLPTIELFDSLNAPATAQQIGISKLYLETYNSTVLIQSNNRIGPIHKKTVLVPFAERIPYADKFRFLIEPLKWNVGISNWGKGNDTTVYSTFIKDKQVKYSGMICYESVYPDYVREFVRHGAELLIIITNDSWWGNTSGAYQHAAFTSLRAIETRRWIVQCANGGISMIVDPVGKPHLTTILYTKAKFVENVGLRSEQTFYVKYGDIVACLCIILSVLMLITAIIYKTFKIFNHESINKIV